MAPDSSQGRRPALSRARTSAQVAQALTQRILSGSYVDGDRLPSCRHLAQELHVDKNTVDKAYRLLAEQGIVKSIPGKGVFVLRRPGAPVRSEVLWAAQLLDLVWQAKAVGLAEDRVWALLEASMRDVYRSSSVTVAFVECNDHEAHTIAQRLADHLSVPVQPLLLKDFLVKPDEYLRAFPMIATTFTHLAAVTRAAGDERRNQIVGLHAFPLPGDVLRIATAPKGSRVGIICTTEDTLGSIGALIRAYNPDVEPVPHLATDSAELAEFLKHVDLVVDTMSTHTSILQLAPRMSLITIAYMVDEQSVEFLRNRILEIARERRMRLPSCELTVA